MPFQYPNRQPKIGCKAFFLTFIVVLFSHLLVAQAPVITSFSPTAGSRGTKVTIKGKNFTAPGWVTFGGTQADSAFLESDSVIYAYVGPKGSGDVVFFTAAGKSTVPGFTYTGPVINAMSPLYVGPGTTVTIRGLNFTGVNGVEFGGWPAASFSVLSDSLITAVLGNGAAGDLKLITPAVPQTLTSGYVFTTNVPSIYSVSPLSGPVGTTVTINGSNFETTAANNIVYFGATKATVASATALKLTVTVPAGATHEPITVISRNRAVRTANAFVPTFTGLDSIRQVTFAIKSASYTTSGPGAMLLKDLDGDGKPDMVVINMGANTNSISVFKNFSTTGTLVFGTKVDYATGTAPRGIDIGDIDGDGKPDIVVANSSSNSVSVFRNTSSPGTISLAAKVDYATGTTPLSVAVADITVDGRPEIITANSGANTMSVFRNTSSPGAVSFAARVDKATATGGQPGCVVVGNVDLDPRPDVVVTNAATGTVSVFWNSSFQNDVAFSPRMDFACGAAPRDVTIADLDNDGRAELIIAPYSTGNSVSILRNIGGPAYLAFEPYVSFGPIVSDPPTTDNGPVRVVTGDLNGDGKPDLIVANQAKDKLTLLRNTSSSSGLAFGQVMDLPLTSSSPYGAAIGDLDNDGKADIVSSCYGLNQVMVYKNRGDSATRIDSFSPTAAGSGDTVHIVGRYFTGATQVSFGGMDPFSYQVVSDTLIKAVVWDGRSGTISVLAPKGDFYLEGFDYLGPAVHMMNPGIGGPGTVITIGGYHFTGATSVMFGGVPAASFTVESDTVITAVIGAGAPGVLSVETPKGLTVAYNFTFTLAPYVYGFSQYAGPAGTSVNIKGLNFSAIPDSNTVYFGPVKGVVTASTIASLDVTVPVGAASQQPTVTVKGLTATAARQFVVTFPGGGSLPFTSSALTPQLQNKETIKPIGSAIADLDNDGKPDVVVANKTTAHGIAVYRNNGAQGAIAFQQSQQLLPGQGASQLAVGDVDGDGKKDVVTADMGATFTVVRNTSTTGNISFATPVAITTRSAAASITIADIDGDRKPDVIVASATEKFISIYRNTGTRGSIAFASRVDFATKGIPLCVIARDFNNDGRIDLAVSSTEAGQSFVSTYRSTSTAGFINLGTRADIVTPNTPSWLLAQDLNDDTKAELIVSFGANMVNVYRFIGNPSGELTFAPPVSISEPGVTDLSALAVEDVNGDGKIDVVISRGQAGKVVVAKNTSDGINLSFTLSPDYPAMTAKPVFVSAGDLDGDSKPDLVVLGTEDSTVAFIRNAIGEAGLVPSGAHPVTGPVDHHINVDSTVQLLNGSPYVQRHYDIEPRNNGSTATATLTLYYSQQDFDNFNAHPAHGFDLPKNPTDSAGKANLRIYQYHGFSAAALPGTYSDTLVVINPADDKIVWDTAALNWKVTFDVAGFSGFFASSAGFSYIKVAGPLITLTGVGQVCQGDSTLLTSSIATNNQWYKDGVAIAGATAKTYQAKTAGTYTATAMVNEVRTQVSTGQAITVQPLPVQPVVTRSGAALSSSAVAGNQWYRNGTLIAGATAQTYSPSEVGNYSVKVTTNGCTSVNSENYSFAPTGVINIDGTHFISLAPNPVTDYMLLNFNLAGVNNLTVQVVDVQGKTQWVFRNMAAGARLALPALPAGLYFARISSSNGKLNYTMKFLKQ